MMVSVGWPDRCMAWIGDKLSSLTLRQRAFIALALSPLLFVIHLTIGLAWGLGWGFMNAVHEVHQSWGAIRGRND